MNRYFWFFMGLTVIMLSGCTYNLPADNRTRGIDSNLVRSQSPKTLKALKRAITASDQNRSMEYEVLQSKLDSSTVVLQVKIAAIKDSMVVSNLKLENKNLQLQKKLEEMQFVLYAILILVFVILIYLLYRFPVSRKIQN